MAKPAARCRVSCCRYDPGSRLRKTIQEQGLALMKEVWPFMLIFLLCMYVFYTIMSVLVSI